MAISKRIIVLEHYHNAPIAFRYVMWADVPVARQPFYANANKVSEWKGASAADNLALQNGSVYEIVDTVSFPVGTTVNQAKTVMQARWQLFQDEITTKNIWGNYGMFMDTTNTWTNGGVA